MSNTDLMAGLWEREFWRHVIWMGAIVGAAIVVGVACLIYAICARPSREGEPSEKRCGPGKLEALLRGEFTHVSAQLAADKGGSQGQAASL